MDMKDLEEILLQVSRFVQTITEIGKLDLNPVFARSTGEDCRVVAARIQIKR